MIVVGTLKCSKCTIYLYIYQWRIQGVGPGVRLKILYIKKPNMNIFLLILKSFVLYTRDNQKSSIQDNRVSVRNLKIVVEGSKIENKLVIIFNLNNLFYEYFCHVVKSKLGKTFCINFCVHKKNVW